MYHRKRNHATFYPQTGHDALSKIEFPWPIADIILQYHEVSTAPDFRGGRGAAILIEARVLAVAGAGDRRRPGGDRKE